MSFMDRLSGCLDKIAADHNAEVMAIHMQVRKALDLIESEPDTIGLYSAACELRAVLGMHARGIEAKGLGGCVAGECGKEEKRG